MARATPQENSIQRRIEEGRYSVALATLLARSHMSAPGCFSDMLYMGSGGRV
jgi:hypothetical protein